MLSAVLFGSASSATPLLSNIIVNGNAEADVGGNYNDVVVPSGWMTTGNFAAVRYSVGGVDELNTAISVAVGGGANFFAGGPNNALATASQMIDIADLAASIDAGQISAAFSALIGGWTTQDDNILIEATFRDASSIALLSLSLGPASPSDRGNISALLPYSTNAALPVGVRSIDVVMTSTRLDGDYNDGYADNLSLILRDSGTNTVPIPSTLLLCVSGLAALAASRRRRAN